MDGILALLSQPEAWAALATLIVMEVVLGIDNLIFLSILTNKLPPERRATARYIGLGLALFMRLGLLFTITIIIGLTQPVFSVFGHGFSWRDLILIGGGLFLVYKATKEIHESVDPHDAATATGGAAAQAAFTSVILQIIVIDLVFSLDSIITAVGMTEHLPIMVVAVIFAIVVMVIAAGPLADFIKHNPTIVMLALSFLLMIGMVLIADGFGFHVPKGYIYAAMAFSILVEILNMVVRRGASRRELQAAKGGTPPITQRAIDSISEERGR